MVSLVIPLFAGLDAMTCALHSATLHGRAQWWAEPSLFPPPVARGERMVLNLVVALCTGQGDTGGSAGGGGDAARSKKPRKERGEREKKQKKSRPEKPAKPAKVGKERKRPVQPEPLLSRLGLCGAVFCLCGTVLMPQIIPGSLHRCGKSD